MARHYSTNPEAGDRPHTFRKRAEARCALEGAEGFFRGLVERIPAVVYVDASDEVSSAIYMSPKAEAMLGYAPEEWTAVPDLWARILHPEDRQRVLSEASRTRRTGEPFALEYRLVARDGSVVWVRDEGEPVEEDGRPPVWHGVLLDVTARKEAEAALARSEERFRRLVENVREGIARISPEGGVIEYCNPAYAEILGLTPDEAVGRSFFEFVEGRDQMEARRQRELRLAGVGSRYELTATAADGRRRVLLCGGYPLHSPDGAYEGAVQTVADVTEHRRAEEALKESEERYRTTFEQAPVGLARVAPDGRWLLVNRRLCELSGYPREELLALTYLDLTPKEDLEDSLGRAGSLLRGEIGSYAVERRYVRKDGRRVWVRLSVSLVRGPSGEPGYFTCMAEDITGRKLKELVPDPLTDRELEVLCLVAEGKSDPQVAEDLCYSLGTVKRDLRGVFCKLGVRDRRAASERAVSIGLIAPWAPACTPRGPRRSNF